MFYVTENIVCIIMDSFDPSDHDEFTAYVIGNKKHFDEIEARHLATKTTAGDLGKTHFSFIVYYLVNFVSCFKFQSCLMVKSLVRVVL